MPLAVVTVFVATFLLAALAVWVARLLQDRRRPGVSSGSPQSLIPHEEEESLISEEAELSTIAAVNWLLSKLDFVEAIQNKLEQADLNWSVGRVFAAMLLSGALSMSLLGLLPFISTWGQLAISAFAALLPYFYIASRRNQRLRKIEEQFPEAMESVARAMRAGYAFAGALENVTRHARPPLRKELVRVVNETSLGLPLEQALLGLAERLPIQEVHLFVAAVQVQSRAGGDLSEVLEKFAENMREAAALRGEVRSLSSQGRFAGYILTALPIAIGLAMFVVAPDFMRPLFEEEIGRTLLMCAAGGLVAAHLIIRKLVDIRL
ncbi:MAG: type II secretion system F family protein [Bryobacteraceae bacterium]|nr:type II secretion system F family protein [Bryobacteraceae bacterium]MDW8377092.1 type II secretion system F family protein [Bryobacterales bacterium]